MKIQFCHAIATAVLLLVSALPAPARVDLGSPGTAPPPAISPPRGSAATIQATNIVATSLSNIGLTPGRAYQLGLLDGNGQVIDDSTVLTVGPDLLDPKGSAVVLDLWDTSMTETVNQASVHFAQGIFKADRNGITFYGARLGVNPLQWSSQTALFPKGVPIPAKSKLAVPKTYRVPYRDGQGSNGTASVQATVGTLNANGLVVVFLWETGNNRGVSFVVDPSSGLDAIWINGFMWVVLDRL